MNKISLEKYFHIFNFMKKQKEENFKSYKQKVQNYDKVNKIKLIEDYYNSESKDDKPNLVFLNKIQFISLILTIFIGIVVFISNIISFNDDINIKIYLLFSILLPLLFMIYGVWKLAKSSFSVPTWILSVFFNNKNDAIKKHNRIIKAYPNIVLSNIGMFYSLATLLSSIIIFWAYSVSFHTESTYDLGEPNQSVITSQEDKKENSISNYSEKSQGDWSKNITIALIVILLGKFIVIFFAKRNMSKAIEESLKEQNYIFFEAMETEGNSQITAVKSGEAKKPYFKDKATLPLMDENEINTSFKDYYCLYYNMDKKDNENIIFDFSKEKSLKDKTSLSYSFALFKEENNDEKTVRKLSNLVLIFTSPESAPDNTFKRDMHFIISNPEVKQVWVLPLIHDSSYYTLMGIENTKYAEWKRQINTTIQNKRIKLYYER